MIRFILYLILFYLIYRLAKKVLGFFSAPSSKVEGSSVKKERTFDPKNIEDIDYEEIKRKK
jgi:hypothetical protein